MALRGGDIRHEMLHALLKSVGHPRQAFLDKCGGVVDCDDSCIADAGPPPLVDPATPTVTPDQVSLAIAIAPATPSMAIDGGFFAVTVSVTNPSNHAVVVVLPDRNASNLGTSFAYHVQGPFGGLLNDVRPSDPGALRFAANETKRHVFDFRVGFDSSARDFPPGTYSVGAEFGVGQPWTYLRAVFQP